MLIAVAPDLSVRTARQAANGSFLGGRICLNVFAALPPLQFALDCVTDELSHPIRTDKCLDPLSRRDRETYLVRLQIEWRTTHSPMLTGIGNGVKNTVSDVAY